MTKVFTLDKATMPHHVRLELSLLREDPLKKGRKKLLQNAALEVEFTGEENATDAFKMIAYVMAGWEREIKEKATKAETIAKETEDASGDSGEQKLS